MLRSAPTIMPTCAQCGVEHDLLDPTFRRPEPYVRLDAAAKSHAKADDDLCTIALPRTRARFFVRGTLFVHVVDWQDGMRWGLWAEIAEDDFTRVLALWTDEHQSAQPPFAGTLANLIPSYPDTLGIPLVVRLSGPTTRPTFELPDTALHPFADECRAGVTLHRVHEWNRLYA